MQIDTVDISDLLMTPINNFIYPNDWANYLPECGAMNIIRHEDISEC